jgi:hypothetical protein
MVVLVVPVGDVEVEVVVFLMVDMILVVVVRLGVMSLTNALIVAIVIILRIIVGIYTTNHLGLPIKFPLRRILQPHLDHLLA